MAIVNETRTINGRDFSYTYSDAGKYILQTDTGAKYAEAYDVLDHDHVYEETDEDIPAVPEAPVETDISDDGDGEE